MSGKTDLLARYILRPGVLDSQAAEWISKVPFDSPAESADRIKRDLDAGKSVLLNCFAADGRRVGVTVYRIEDHDLGRELVSIASFGSDGGADLTREVLPMVEAVARSKGCVSVRLHTMRAGLIRKLLKDDYFVSEVVLRKRL